MAAAAAVAHHSRSSWRIGEGLALQRNSHDSGSVMPVLTVLLLSVPAVAMLGWTVLRAGGARSLFAPVAAAPVPAPAPAPPATAVAKDANAAGRKIRGFEAADVVEMARRLAAEPPRARGAVTPGLEQLNYDQYRDIRFRIDQALWTGDRTAFRIDLLPAGFVYTAPVAVAIVEDGVVHAQVSDPAMFELGPSVPKDLHGKSLSLSGFRVRTQLNSRQYWDEFLVFQGASYFRAVGRGQNYGLSARGLALQTGDAEGEEFPAFTQFWIEKPAPKATELVIHALLESPSLTGAYRFRVRPGQDTQMDVEYTLFPRKDLRNVGIAPLTSMFLFDGTNRQRFDDFRYRVHDSDGLLFTSQGGEQVWRQLANPRNLQLSTFSAERPRAFGLIQRARLQAEYQDLEANYERRPSAWVEFPQGAPPGPLRLVEIPTARETNDNIVAFWQPREVLPAGRPYTGSYLMHWTSEALIKQPYARFVAARMGTNFEGNRKLIALDLAGAGIVPEGLELEVSASGGKVFHPVIQANPPIRGLRASFEFDPDGAALIEFRVIVRRMGQPVSETWLYRWTPA
jgi:periplasmic glucans biosynthesis protein